MSNLNKLKFCGQSWNNMTETNGGRICGKCEKIIVDFSKSKWAEIEKKQNENGNSLCGMYSKKQLEHWGHQPPIIDLNYRRPLFLSSFLISLFSITPKTSASQNTSTDTSVTRENYQNVFYVNSNEISENVFIRGRMFDKSTNEGIPFASVGIREMNAGTMTDSIGFFELDITKIADTTKKYSIIATYIGYVSNEIVITNKILNSIEINFPMVSGSAITYSVEVPKKKRFFNIRTWFKRK